MTKKTKLKLYIFIFLFMAILFIAEHKLGLNGTGGIYREIYVSQQIRLVSWEKVWNDRGEIIFSILFVSCGLMLLLELLYPTKKNK